MHVKKREGGNDEKKKEGCTEGGIQHDRTWKELSGFFQLY
jgi:hypothetical protein